MPQAKRLFTLKINDKELGKNLTLKQLQDKMAEHIVQSVKESMKALHAATITELDSSRKYAEQVSSDGLAEDYDGGVCSEIYVSDVIALPGFDIIEQCHVPKAKVKFVTFRK